MEKRLEVKVKKIVGQANPKEGKWADFLVHEPSDQELAKKRGQLFAVLDLTGSPRLNLSDFGQQTLEALRGGYYASEESSPLRALEEATHKAKHHLIELAFGPKGAVPDSALNYNFAAAVLWGVVLYVVKLGASGIYLRRGGVVEELGETRDGKVFSASGMVRDGDGVVLGSSDFRRTFSAAELPEALGELETLVGNLGNPAGMAALVLRLELASVPGEEEELRIASVVKKESSIKKLLKRFSFPRFPKKVLLAIPVLLFLGATIFTIKKRQNDLRAAEVGRLVSQAEQALADAERYIDLNNSRARELLLEAREGFEAAEKVAGRQAARQVLGASEKMEEINALLDRANKVTRVRPEKVEGAEVSFDPLAEVESSPSVEGAVDTGTYFGNLYFLVPGENQILKAAVVAGGEYAEPRYWVVTENPPLGDSVSMAIDGFIYVLKADGKVLKFEKGELVSDFGLKELDRPLVDPRAIFTTVDSNHLYILDTGSRRVVITSKEGFYESQYVFEDASINPTDLFVDEDARTVYLLEESAVFRFGM